MRKSIIPFLCFLLFLPNSFLFAKPVFTQGSYLIAVLSERTVGTVSPGNANYQLAYHSDRNEESALASDYWIIEEQAHNQYSFRNAATRQYIRYDQSASEDRRALKLVDKLASDGSTLFSLELKKTNKLPYYIIRSVVDPVKGWNKRGTQYESLYPVGVYNVSGSENELFIFYDSEGDTVSDDAMGSIESPRIKRTLGAFQNYADSLSFNSQMPVVDTPKKEFCLTIPESQMDGNLTMKVNFQLKNSAHTLFINNQKVTNGNDFNFGYVSASTKLPIEIRNNTTVVASGSLYFSCLPLVQIFSTTSIGTVYGQGGLVVVEPEKAHLPEILHMTIKIRGAMSMGLPKKAYAIKLKDSDCIK